MTDNVTAESTAATPGDSPGREPARRLAIRLAAIVVAMAATNALALLLLQVPAVLFSGAALVPNRQAWSVAIVQAYGLALLTLFCFGIEIRALGWERSSLRRLLDGKSASRRTDRFYLALSLSGFRPVFAFAFTAGIGYALNLLVERHLSLHLLAHQNAVVSFAAVILANTFTFYWVHRIMHTRLFWPLHKVHHSAEEMNIVTPHRNHPVDFVVAAAVNAIPAAVLGAPLWISQTYIVLNGVYQSLVHTDMDWNLPFVERYLLISSSLHRLHHSRAPEHLNKNFGILILWDVLFGTARFERSRDVRLGVDDAPEHNTGAPLRELWRIYAGWLRGLVSSR